MSARDARSRPSSALKMSQLIPFRFACSSDADSDVLADYVLALIRSDAPDDEIRQTSVENLEDFLRESALGLSVVPSCLLLLTQLRHQTLCR